MILLEFLANQPGSFETNTLSSYRPDEIYMQAIVSDKQLFKVVTIMNFRLLILNKYCVVQLQISIKLIN